MTFELPPLPYPEDALAPHVSAETLRLHHGKHHASYVKKLNELVAGSPELEGVPLDDIIRSARGELFNNAAQHWNHSFYWHCMTPRGGSKPTGKLGSAIESRWGSLASFRDEFTQVALDTFGSGWAWLVIRDGELAITSTGDADTPLRTGVRPLLTCDVWEHAYYVDHRNDRAAYLKAFFEVVDWEFASKNMGVPEAVERAAARGES